MGYKHVLLLRKKWFTRVAEKEKEFVGIIN